jgi:FkbM family methyltransferase
MKFSYFFRRLALAMHLCHERAYTCWKVRESRQRFRAPLTFQEKRFFLKIGHLFQEPGMVVYDIGASTGVVSGCLAKMPSVAAVHAFEPIPGQFRRLQANMAPYAQVRCHQVALGDGNCIRPIKVMDNALDASSFLTMADLHWQEFSGSFAYHEELVPMVRLDDYVQEKKLPAPDFVKIDVQGFEDKVLAGGGHTIRQAGYCLLEISFRPLYEGSPVFDDIYRQMRELGFRLSGIVDVAKGKSGAQLYIDGIFENETLIR